jgi:hypothetical protein
MPKGRWHRGESPVLLLHPARQNKYAHKLLPEPSHNVKQNPTQTQSSGVPLQLIPC